MPTSFHRFSFEAMTTSFDAAVVHEDKKYAGQAAAAVFAEIERYERLLSRHEPGTDISQINRLQPGQWMRVNLEILECLEIAARGFIETGGAFDVCFRSTADGTRPSAMNFLLLSRPESDEPESSAEYLVGIDPEAAKYGFQGADIDLGGIGKGYALDKVILLFDDWGLDNLLLNAGTSTVLAKGVGPDGKGWPVGVSGDYRAETGISSTLLVDEALSGSGTAIKGEHIRDPQTGEAARAIAAWGKAKTAAWTEVMSTALMVMQRPNAEKFLQESRQSVSAVAIYKGDIAPGILVFGDW